MLFGKLFRVVFAQGRFINDCQHGDGTALRKREAQYEIQRRPGAVGSVSCQ